MSGVCEVYILVDNTLPYWLPKHKLDIPLIWAIVIVTLVYLFILLYEMYCRIHSSAVVNQMNSPPSPYI